MDWGLFWSVAGGVLLAEFIVLWMRSAGEAVVRETAEAAERNRATDRECERERRENALVDIFAKKVAAALNEHEERTATLFAKEVVTAFYDRGDPPFHSQRVWHASDMPLD